MWYKLTKQTKYGAYISGFGAIITFSVNLAFIPTYGYLASAYATLGCYGSMMILSYLFGQRFYPIPYNLKKILIYLGSGAIIFFVSMPFNPMDNYGWLGYFYHSFLIIVFILIVYFLERREKKMIPS